MDNDSQPFGHAPRASSDDSASGHHRSPDAFEDLFAEIGYEAAYPSLQAPLWHDATRSLPARRDRR
jgi:hypothetical protein